MAKGKSNKRYAALVAVLLLYVVIFVMLSLDWLCGDGALLEPAERGRFFDSFSPVHILWGVWLVDTLARCFRFPGARVAFSKHMITAAAPERGSEEDIRLRALRHRGLVRSLATLGLLWLPVAAAIALLLALDVVSGDEALLASAALFVADSVCVLFFCPFRTVQRNRCCADCLIANFDRIMIFLPMAFTGSFFFISLTVAAAFPAAVWCVALARHPERFFPETSHALRCASCSERACRHRIF